MKRTPLLFHNSAPPATKAASRSARSPNPLLSRAGDACLKHRRSNGRHTLADREIPQHHQEEVIVVDVIDEDRHRGEKQGKDEQEKDVPHPFGEAPLLPRLRLN